MVRKKRNPITCFVIMPFGEKTDADGKVINFDKIYQSLIKDTIESLGITCVRCDEIREAGWIHSKMFEHIYNSDVAIVDITSLNPNVFYELGVRHALVESGTVLIRRKGTAIPFNIQGFQVIEYDRRNIENDDEAKKKIADLIQNGLKLKKKDSPVYEVLDLKIGTVPKELTKTEYFTYKLRNVNNKEIGLVTGDLRNVKGIDVWVNPENTKMQMARHEDRSISSTIRYCGAKKTAGRVVDDLIANELAQVAGENANIPPAEILVTDAGYLERTHGVKKIFHAAVVVGQVGKGYTPIADVSQAVRNALDTADSQELAGTDLKSILFPLMGTGTGRGELKQKAMELIDAAISHLQAHPRCKFERVYFLARNERDLEVCQHILQQTPEVVVA